MAGWRCHALCIHQRPSSASAGRRLMHRLRRGLSSMYTLFLIIVLYCICTYLFITINNLNLVIFFINWINSYPLNSSLHISAWNDVANHVPHYRSINCVSVIACIMHVCEFYVSHILEKLFKDSMFFLCQSAIVSKPCPTCPGSFIPLDIIRMGVPWWTFLPICVWLGHRIITNHVWVITKILLGSIEMGSFP
jgi:hypothetical protein